MLDFYMDQRSSIMVDSRLDAFNEKVLDDCVVISNARSGWQDLLNQYDIEWSIVIPGQLLGDALVKESNGL